MTGRKRKSLDRIRTWENSARLAEPGESNGKRSVRRAHKGHAVELCSGQKKSPVEAPAQLQVFMREGLAREAAVLGRSYKVIYGKLAQRAQVVSSHYASERGGVDCSWAMRTAAPLRANISQ